MVASKDPLRERLHGLLQPDDDLSRGALFGGRLVTDDVAERFFTAGGATPVLRSIVASIREAPEPFVERFVNVGATRWTEGPITDAHALKYAIDMDPHVRKVAYAGGFIERVIEDIKTAPTQSITWLVRDGRPFGDVPMPHWLDRVQALLDAMAKLRADRQHAPAVRARIVKVLADSVDVVIERFIRDRELIGLCAKTAGGADVCFALLTWTSQANDWPGCA